MSTSHLFTRFGFDQWGVFSTGDASAILGVSRRKVLLYVEQGFLEPSLPSEGRGHGRRFSFRDLLNLSATIELERLGIAPRYLIEFTDLIREIEAFTPIGDVRPELTFSLDDKGKPVLRDPDDSIQEAKTAIVVIPLRRLFKKLQNKVDQHYDKSERGNR